VSLSDLSISVRSLCFSRVSALIITVETMKGWDVYASVAIVAALSFLSTSQGNTVDASFKESRFKRQGSSRLWSNHGLFTDLGVPEFWNQYNDGGPYGIVIRGWQFSRCASEQWTKYGVNVTNLVIWPKYPRFPGPIFFNVTAEIHDDLPTDRIEVEVEIRHAVATSDSQKGWQVLPCQGWNLLDGCDGVGSCKYCDVLDRCRKGIQTAKQHIDDRKIQDALRNPQKLCPPPKGTWTLSFSQVFKVEDIPKGIFGPLQSNEYWLTFTFTNGRGTQLACARVWMDICKYHLFDRQQKCLRDPYALQNFLNQITKQG